MEIFEILPSPLAVVPCPFHEKMKRTIFDEMEKIKDTDWTKWGSDELKHMDSCSFLDLPELERLSIWIEEQAEIFCREVKGDHLVDGVIVTDSWLNVCGPGGMQGPHYHTNSYLSGLYYVNFDADIHAPTYFYKTQSSHMFAPSTPNISLMTDKNTKYTEPQPFTAQEGELILWSSELIHGYKPNQGDTRVTLSFNIMPKVVTSGEYGWKVEKLSPRDRLACVENKKSGKIWGVPHFQ
tara:strand:+ start:4112 stop:4825 length:714 start_codon:yes stop_codon:yes gene_type:complete